MAELWFPCFPFQCFDQLANMSLIPLWITLLLDDDYHFCTSTIACLMILDFSKLYTWAASLLHQVKFITVHSR